VVYIAEAHAADEWPVSTKVRIKQHADLKERVRCATAFAKAMKLENCDILVDSMSDAFTNALAAHPLRYYVVDGRTSPPKLQYIAKPICSEGLASHRGEYRGYDLDDLCMYLNVGKGSLNWTMATTKPVE